MRIIKLQVETIIDRGIQILKYAVSLDRKRYSKISQFISHVKKICRLSDQIYRLEYEGFTIPNYDKTQVLQEEHVYRLRICQNNGTKKDYQIKSSQIESEEEDIQYESVRKNKNERSNSQRISKVQQKLQKIVRKKKNIQSSLSDSQEQSDSSSSQLEEQESSSSQSSQSSPEPKRKAKTNDNLKAIAQLQAKKPTPRPLMKKQLPVEQAKGLKDKSQANKKNPFIQRKVESSPSSSSSSQLKKVPIKQFKSKIPAKNIKIPDNAKQTQVSKSNQNPLKNTKRAVIADSSSQSQPSQTPPVKKPPPIINASIVQQANKKVQQNVENAQIDKPKSDLKLPPALINKFVKKNFDQHKQNQWIAIDKEGLKKWQQLGNKTVCQTNNKIRFKIVELDQQKFIPVKSGWITGEVKGVESSGVINLGKVQQQGKPYQQKYNIPQHNMDQLQLNRLLATKQQIQFFSHKQKENSQQQSQIQNKPQPKQQKSVSKNEQVADDKNSLEKYICGQANYYFSDKNYNFDLFMQMHANKHPEKYLNLGILLNFPKIKKLLHDKQKLYQYLKEDEKYPQRTYEIDFQNQLIRKKGIYVQQIKQINPEDGQIGEAQFARENE